MKQEEERGITKKTLLVHSRHEARARITHPEWHMYRVKNDQTTLLHLVLAQQLHAVPPELAPRCGFSLVIDLDDHVPNFVHVSEILELRVWLIQEEYVAW